MVKKSLSWLRFYHIPTLIIFGLLFFFARRHLLLFLVHFTSIPDNRRFILYWSTYEVLQLVVNISLLFIWLSVCITSIRYKRYKKLTGRNLSEDTKRFNRSYKELVRYFKDADLLNLPEELLPKQSWKTAEGVILGKTKDGRVFNVPSGKDGKNYFIFGLPSIGKTAGPIKTTCLRFGMKENHENKSKKTFGSVFCIDLKGDILESTKDFRPIKVFSLITPETSCKFNVLEGIESMSLDERIKFIERIGYNIVQAPSDGEGEYFYTTALDYWNGVALLLLHQNIHISFPEIIEKILLGNAVDWVKTAVDSDCEESKRFLQNKWGENEKNLAGGYSNLCKSCRKFSSETLSHLLDNSEDGEYISMQTLEDGWDVYIQVEQTELPNYNSLLSLICDSFITAALSREHNPNAGRDKQGILRPIAFILDEFAQLKTLSYDTISTAFMTARSRNISIICALQSLSSISEMFHSENATKSLVDAVTTFCFLSIQEVSTRQWASDLIGTKKVLKLSNNVSDGNGKSSSGFSVQEAREPIFLPEEFGNLKDAYDGRDELIIYSAGKYIRLDKQYYFQ